MDSPLFCQSLRNDFGLQGIHLFQATIFIFQFLHAGHQRGIHAAELGAPLVEGGVADAVLAAQLGDRRATLDLLEMAMIWLSAKRDVFMQNFQNLSLVNSTCKRDQLLGEYPFTQRHPTVDVLATLAGCDQKVDS